MNIKKTITLLTLTLATLLCGVQNISAQTTYSNGLASESVDPEGDAKFLAESRALMDKIRREQHRPTVGLVLSGGGAKGGAQVGVIKYLEEMGFHADLVCGTSIGGMLGCLYAMGYSADEIEELFTSQDWDYMLSDLIDQKYVPYEQKMRESTYILNIPFQVGTDILDGDEVMESVGGIASSLPAAYAGGFNVGNLISRMTVGYQEDMSFQDFPVPFACVATDLVSRKAKYWGYGSVQDAVRSTMSIPALFDPVKTDGMILTDGGTRDNFPTYLAKAMGADIIVGVTLADASLGYSEINNIGDILGCYLDMLTYDNLQQSIDLCDILIKPDVTGYGMLSFSPEAVDTLIARGYQATDLKRAELADVVAKTAHGKHELNAPKAIDVAKQQLSVGEIVINGLEENESRKVSSLLDIHTADIVDKAIIEDRMSVIFATGAFEKLNYSLIPEDGGSYTLVIDCEKASANTLSFGFRMDTKEMAAMQINLAINRKKLMGSKFDVTTRLGQNLDGSLRYSLVIEKLPTINVDLSWSRRNNDLIAYIDDSPVRSDEIYTLRSQSLYFSDMNWKKFNFQAGMRNRSYSLNERTVLARMAKSLLSDDVYGKYISGDYVGAFLNAHVYSMDDIHYPSRGTDIYFAASYDFADIYNIDFWPVATLQLDYRQVLRLGSAFALIPEIHYRSIFDTNNSTDVGGSEYFVSSVIHANYFGGARNTRHNEGHAAFFGLNDIYQADDNYASAVVNLRWNPYKKFYVTAMAGAFVESNEFKGIFDFSPEIVAAGLELAYNFSFGPVRTNVHYSNLCGWEAFFSLGYDF